MKSISKTTRNLGLSALAVTAFALLAAVTPLLMPRDGEARAQEAGPPATVVETAAVEQVGLRRWSSFSGRLTAVEEARIRPLVGGTVKEVLFEDGALVEAGQALFVIDPRPFEVALQEAEAALVSARSRQELARVELERAEKLAAGDTISQSQRDGRANDLRTARAAVEAAQARVAAARLNLEYAHIEAPIAGRIGRAEVTVGNVVEAGPGAPVLATVVANDRLYVEFDVDEASYFQALGGTGLDAHAGTIPVEVRLDAKGGELYQGRLHAFDNRLDLASGTLRARAIVENLDGALIPGIFADVRLGSRREEPTLLVPARAVGVNQDKRFVYVVDADDRVGYREVVPGEVLGARRVIEAGLTAGERVVVGGVQRVASGMLVDARPYRGADAGRVNASL